MAATAPISTRTAGGLAGLLGNGTVQAVFQPLVELASGDVIGYESLARGPRGSTLASPAALFAAARKSGVERELEWECTRAAFRGALDAGLSGRALFVNREPRFLGAEPPADVVELLETVLERAPVFAEFTERSLTDQPAQLLSAVQRMRRRGVGIALDDVGAEVRSLALMPYLAPDVIKLDLRLVQEKPSPQIAEIVHAVSAEAERTGALVLAEGIETEEHRQTALAMGARYGQGWLFGRPGRLVQTHGNDGRLTPHPNRTLGLESRSPFEVVAHTRATRIGTKRLLLALSRQIEAGVPSLGPAAVVLSTFQEARFFTPATAALYTQLGGGAALVGALGVGLPEQPAPMVRGVALDRADPLRGEWDVSVISPHFSVAFVARELGDDGPDMDRRFEFTTTYDRALAIEAARAMMSRLAGQA
jgi:EAL domain-containing protein (putative c-di-GMP-specific phosphodiesterase class I)